MTDTLTYISPDLDVYCIVTALHEEAALDARRIVLRKEMGRALGNLRKARKLSFRKAGELLNCDPGLLNRVEKGNAWAYTVVQKALELYPTIPAVTE